MARNLFGSKRGFGYDPTTRTLDLFVDSEIHTKNAGPQPKIYEESSTQLYNLGTRLVTDERVFRYCRAGAALNRSDGAMNNDQWSLTNENANQDAAVGDTDMQVVNTTGTQNQYQGGWVAIFTSRLQLRHIIANDASDGTDIKLYLDGPIEVAMSTTWVTGYPSIYYDTRTFTEEYTSVVCVPPIAVTSGYYYWGQTWGPCYMRAAGTVPGISVYDRDVYFAGTGAIYGGKQAESATAGGYQRAGILLPRTASGTGDQFFMLQLSP